MKRIVVLTYGLVNYAIFLGTFLYLAGFTGESAGAEVDGFSACRPTLGSRWQ